MSAESSKVRPSRGPHGLGDPEDKSLRKVETDVLIPKKMREISRMEKCTKQVAEFNKCCKDSGLSMVVKCRSENTALWGCLEKWYFDEDFKLRCTNEYLAERSEFRRTGVKKVKNVRAQIRKETKSGQHAAAESATNST